jgi:hypothetical protein
VIPATARHGVTWRPLTVGATTPGLLGYEAAVGAHGLPGT